MSFVAKFDHSRQNEYTTAEVSIEKNGIEHQGCSGLLESGLYRSSIGYFSYFGDTLGDIKDLPHSISPVADGALSVGCEQSTTRYPSDSSLWYILCLLLAGAGHG